MANHEPHPGAPVWPTTMANHEPHPAARLPRAPSAPPIHVTAHARPGAGARDAELPPAPANAAKGTHAGILEDHGRGLSSHPISVGGTRDDQLPRSSAIPTPSSNRLNDQDAGSLPSTHVPSGSPRRHHQHRISHLIESLRHLHVPHPHRHEPHHTHEPNGAPLHLSTSDNSAGSAGGAKPYGGTTAPAAATADERAEKLEQRRSFRKSWDPSMSFKPRDAFSPQRRRLSMRKPPGLSTSPPPVSSSTANHLQPQPVGTIEEKERSFLRSSPAPTPSPSGNKNRVSRSKTRGDKNSNHSSSRRSNDQTRSSSRSNSHHEQGERERREIETRCKALSVDVVEMSPDGHCLYAAVADQLNVLAALRGAEYAAEAKLTYKDTRKAAAAIMRSDPDTYMPFISDSDEKMAGITNHLAGSTAGEDQSKFFLSYCDAVENTAVWGGQPEILALSRAYRTPIIVVQAGTSPLKFGEEFASSAPAHLAYYRAAYGLGEHFNSLRPYTYRQHIH